MLRSVLLFCMVVTCLWLPAQKYTTAAGIRLGSGIGISVQQLLWDQYTLEGIVQKGLLNKQTLVSALFEQHHSMLSKGTNFYIGAGPHFGSYSQAGKTGESRNVFGATFIGGLEMKLGKTLLSFDYKPSLNLTGGNSLFDSQAGVSLRYIFIKAQKKEHKWMFWKKKKSEKKEDQ